MPAEAQELEEAGADDFLENGNRLAARPARMTMLNSKIAIVFAILCAGIAMSACNSEDPVEESELRKSFDSPKAAVASVIAALRADDTEGLEAIFGPLATKIIDTGDTVSDKNRRIEFVELYDEAHKIELSDDKTAILCVGKLEWPFAVPLVKQGNTWFFDSEAGIDEIHDRRVGQNELSCIQTCRAFGDAQMDYVKIDWDKDGIFEYAKKIRSTAGTQDGLYWPTSTSTVQSPLGELAAQASAEGYDLNRSQGFEPVPYHGYYYRVLHQQSENAEGGAHSYMAGDSMIGGFAIVAFPSSYGESGIMTFVMNHSGFVYEKDLGDGTLSIGKKMTTYDPAGSWIEVPEESEEVPEDK